MRKGYIPYLVGFLAGGAIATFSTAEVAINARDEVVRVKVQYADCQMIGDEPTTADIGEHPSIGWTEVGQ